MVTAATATTTMSTDLVMVNAAPADKTSGDGNSFAKSFGEQAGLLIGDDAQQKSGGSMNTSFVSVADSLKAPIGVEAMASGSKLPVQRSGEPAVGAVNAGAASKTDSKTVQQAEIPSVTQLPDGPRYSSADVENMSSAISVVQAATVESRTAVGGMKSVSVGADDKNAPAMAVQHSVPDATAPSVPGQAPEIVVESDPVAIVASGQTVIVQQQVVKEAQQVMLKIHAQGQAGATKKTPEKDVEKKQKVPAAAAGQSPHVPTGDAVLAAAQPIAATQPVAATQPITTPIPPAVTPQADVPVSATTFAIPGATANKGAGASKGSLVSSTSQQSGIAKPEVDGDKSSQQDIHLATVEAAPPGVAASPLVDPKAVVSKDERQAPGGPAQAVSVDSDKAAKPKRVSEATLTKPLVDAGSVQIGVTGATTLVHGVGARILVKPQDNGASVLSATAHTVVTDAGGAGLATQHTMDGTHRTLEASPTTLEIGVPNGTEGWVKIRAEMASGGGVNASLSAASPAGQEMLHRELPSLTAYLQQERVTVNTVVVHQPAPAAALHDQAGNMGGGVGQHAQQRHGQGGDGRQRAQGFIVDEHALQSISTATIEEHLPQAERFGGMSWLSVRV